MAVFPTALLLPKDTSHCLLSPVFIFQSQYCAKHTVDSPSISLELIKLKEILKEEEGSEGSPGGVREGDRDNLTLRNCIYGYVAFPTVNYTVAICFLTIQVSKGSSSGSLWLEQN